MNIDYLVESSKGETQIGIEDSLSALMAMHLAENGTFNKEKYVSEVLELKAKMVEAVNASVQGSKLGFVFESLLQDGIKNVEQKIDYHLNALRQ